MSQAFSTGPMHVFCGVGSNYSPIYFGTSKNGCPVELLPEWDAVFNDLSGTKHPYDKIYEGTVGMVRGDFTRYKEGVYLTMQNRTAMALGGGSVAGIDAAGAIGTLMVTEGAAFPLWIQFPYASKIAMQNGVNGALPNGYHFFAAELEGPDVRKGGTGENAISLVWWCGRVFNPVTGAFSCYDFNMAGLPGLD